jgi:hypothetical protein
MIAKFFWWSACWVMWPPAHFGFHRPWQRAFRRYELAAMKLEDSLR